MSSIKTTKLSSDEEESNRKELLQLYERKDGNNEIISEGSFSVTKNYESYISDVLRLHEQEYSLAHIHKIILKKLILQWNGKNI